MRPALLGLILLYAAGCATNAAQQPLTAPAAPLASPTPLPEAEKPVQPIVLAKAMAAQKGREIEVVTVPGGATITLNDREVGVAPGKFSMVRTPNRYGFLPRMTICAIPPKGSQGLYTQTTVFDGYTETPAKIEFDMSKPPPLPRIEGE